MSYVRYVDVSGIRLGVAFVFALLGSSSAGHVHAAAEIFSEGMEVPETISRIPEGFGDLGGGYLVPDFGFGQAGVGEEETLWLVPEEGGDPTVFAMLDFAPRGGLFLPESFGTVGGQYVVVGEEAVSSNRFDGRIVTFDGEAVATEFLTLRDFDSLTTPVLAPQGFGGLGGQLLITNQLTGVIAIDPAGNVNEIFNVGPFRSQTGLDIVPFGAAFAPSNFGAFGGDLFITDGRTTTSEAALHVLSMDAQGNAELFITIEISEEQAAIQSGLRQLAFVPEGFGVLTGKMLLSVSGSLNGGGLLGELLVIDSDAQVVGKLEIGGGFEKFDPRGVYFRDDGSILISDGSDPILIARPGDFTVPEPATATMWVYLLTAGAIARRTRHS